MARKLAWLSLVVALAVPAWAAGSAGVISGTVRNSSGGVQMGATVEIFGASAFPIATVLTDPNGAFAAMGLDPGSYRLKISAPSFLPYLREDVIVKSGANIIVNVTLNTLFEAIQMLPVRRRTAEDDDDWKWTLRSASNRPILRVLDDGPLVVVSKGDTDDDKVLKARVAFLAGSEAGGFGSAADMTTSFDVEKSLFSAGLLAFNGNVGYSNGADPTAVVRASYSHRFADGSEPQLTITARRFASPGLADRGAALQALAMSLADNVSLFNLLDLRVGSEYQTIQFMGHASAFRPFGSANLHLSKNTVLEYRYDTSLPNTRHMKGFDSAPADFSESGPRMSLTNFRPSLERARHQEISVSRRVGRNNFQIAWFTDRVSDPALVGAGDASAETGQVLPDFYSGTFTYAGRSLNTNGLRIVAQRKLMSDLTATFDYSYGGVLALDQSNLSLSDAQALMAVERRHAVTGKIAGTLPRSHTKWIASYKWASGGMNLTPVDMFNVSAGQSDPYLNLFVRQPIPGTGFMPGHMEALIDVRNLMAQGYVPVMGTDGHTLYLVQSARAIRGGVAFTF